jgi:hypothetical protein
MLRAVNGLIKETDGLNSDKKQILNVLMTFLGSPTRPRKNGEVGRFIGECSFFPPGSYPIHS